MPTELIKEVLSAFGLVGTAAVVVGIIIFIAWGVFRAFGEKWLDSRFKEKLATYQHQQQQALARLQLQISAQLDRASKLSAQEFMVLPEAWSRLHDAYYAVVSFGTNSYRTRAQLDTFTFSELEAFIEESDLASWRKRGVLEAKDKHAYYRHALREHADQKMHSIYFEFSTYLQKNGVFISSEIKSDFETLSELMLDSINENRMNDSVQGKNFSDEKWLLLARAENEQLKDLEKKIQGQALGFNGSDEATRIVVDKPPQAIYFALIYY